MFVDFLTMLSGVGVVGAVSYVLERMPWFQKLSGDIKEYVFFAICAVISVAAYATITYVPADVLSQITPWFTVVATLFTYLFLGKKFHEVDKK
jgi:drug/metabolite transporter (DMT)-like permease